jgi:hypothetical protein
MRKMNKTLFAVLILSMLIALFPTTAEAATTPELNKTKATVCVGKTVKLKVTSASTSTVTWKSSNKKIATVTSSGKVKGVKAGKATITATVGNKSVKCKITVAKHKWVKVEETGHEEKVKTGYIKYVKDDYGHGPYYTNDEWQEHLATGCLAGYVLYNEPVYETKWVVDTEAYSKCSRCNKTK